MMGEHRLLNKSIHTRGRVTLNRRYTRRSVGSCVEWRGVRELREISARAQLKANYMRVQRTHSSFISIIGSYADDTELLSLALRLSEQFWGDPTTTWQSD